MEDREGRACGLGVGVGRFPFSFLGGAAKHRSTLPKKIIAGSLKCGGCV